jgi:hypothetical protein
MTPQEERMWDKKIEKSFRSQQELPNGRNFRYWNHERDTTPADDKYKQNFDSIFPNAPGAGI